MKTQFVLFFALLPLYAAAAGMAGVVQGKPVPQISVPGFTSQAFASAWQHVADNCQDARCIAE
jgi:hypothetical protein